MTQAPTTVSKTEALRKVQAASMVSLRAALSAPGTDPKVRVLIERELDDRANRGSSY